MLNLSEKINKLKTNYRTVKMGSMLHEDEIIVGYACQCMCMFVCERERSIH